LTIDHINGGGRRHIKNICAGKSKNGNVLYRWLKTHNFPPGFQVLCINCQWIKKDEKQECRNLKERTEYGLDAGLV
jgi:hypothetical protein